MDASLVRTWRDFHNMKQWRPPYVLEYRGCGRRLFQVAAVHGNDSNSPTFQIIRSVLARYSNDFIVVEGFPDAFGTSPARMIAYAQQVAGTPGDAEPYLAIRLAVKAGIGFSGGEPTDAQVVREVAAFGLTPADVLGCYILRLIEQWEREERISGPADPRLGKLVEQTASSFAASAGVSFQTVSSVATLDGWKSWYRKLNGVSFKEGYRHDDAYPSGPHTRPSRGMSDAIDDVRDRHIVSVIFRTLKAHQDVLVIYGASHSVVEGPALTAAFGPPRRLRMASESGSSGLHVDPDQAGRRSAR
jgi:hypothetical protein